MSFDVNDKDKKCKEIFDLLADTIINNLKSSDFRWADIALKFLRDHGEKVSELPIPGSKVNEIKASLPFKTRAN